MPTPMLLSDLTVLVKARLSLLVLMTTLAGFFAGWQGPMNYFVLFATLLGTAASAAGASALNQWWERDLDAKMQRTRDRPLPAGRMHPTDALLFGILFSGTGVVTLALFVNVTTALIAATTIGIYILLYTPMKTLSTVNTLVGAVPGALPPLIGWTAATGTIAPEGLFLFGLLWFWQMPHFLAISWMYKEEYEGAGFEMLSNYDPDGGISSRQSFIYSFYLLCVSLLPVLFGFVTMWFLIPAGLLGAGFLLFAWRFFRHPSKTTARALFFCSIIFLPAYLTVYVFAKLIP